MVEFSLETELATFQHKLPELLKTAPGKFVVIRAQKILGIAEDYQHALAVGYKVCGIKQPFFVERVESPEISNRRSRILLTKLRSLNG